MDYAIRIAIEHHENLSFIHQERRSRRHLAVTLTDTDFADDIALVSDNVQDSIK